MNLKRSLKRSNAGLFQFDKTKYTVIYGALSRAARFWVRKIIIIIPARLHMQ